MFALEAAKIQQDLLSLRYTRRHGPTENIEVWMMDGTCKQVLNKHLGAVVNASFSPDGSRIITATGIRKQ